jgi:hypothetical protein
LWFPLARAVAWAVCVVLADKATKETKTSIICVSFVAFVALVWRQARICVLLSFVIFVIKQPAVATIEVIAVKFANIGELLPQCSKIARGPHLLSPYRKE